MYGVIKSHMKTIFYELVYGQASLIWIIKMYKGPLVIRTLVPFILSSCMQ